MKQTFKKYVIVFLTFILLLSVGFAFKASPTFANGPITVYLKGDLKANPATNLVNLSDITTRLNFLEGSDGELYFCLDEVKYYPPTGGTNYNPSEMYPRPEITWLLENFYYNKTIFGNENLETQYAATQIAIWSLTNPDRLPYTRDVIQNNPIVKALVDKANEFKNLPSVEEQLNGVTADVQSSIIKSPSTGAQNDFETTVKVNVLNLPTDGSIAYTIGSAKVNLIAPDGTKTNITNNPNISLTFTSATGEGTLIVKRDYYNSLAAGSKIEVEAPIDLQTDDSLFLVYMPENTSYQPLGSLYNVSLDRAITANEIFTIAPVVDILGSKVWSDANNQDGVRPTEITVQLLANGTVISEKQVSAATNWQFEFVNLPKYNGTAEIIYTVKEVPVAGYTSSINGSIITNAKDVELVSVTVQKVWDDENDLDKKRPSQIVVQLLADGVVIEEATLNTQNEWSSEWVGLNKNKDGKPIVYTVKEKTSIPAYTTAISKTGEYAYTITNKYVPEYLRPPVPGEDDNIVNNPGDPSNPTLPQTNATSYLAFMQYGKIVLCLALMAVFYRNRRYAFGNKK